MHSDLIRQLLEALASGWFFLALSALSAAWLLYRRAKPVASIVVALSIPGTIGAVLMPILMIAEWLPYFGLAAFHPRRLLHIAILLIAMTPSFSVSPVALYFARRRYISERPDYPVKYGISICMLLSITAALTHVITSYRDPIQ